MQNAINRFEMVPKLLGARIGQSAGLLSYKFIKESNRLDYSVIWAPYEYRYQDE